MRFLPLLAAVCLIAVPAMAQDAGSPPPASGETLVLSPPTGWILARSDRSSQGSVAAYVPAGQSGLNWSEMLAVQVFYGTPNAKPAEFLDYLRANVEKNCDSVGAGQTGQAEINGYPSALRVIACTKTKREGRGEVSMYLVLSGRESLYVVQRAWRGEAFQPNAVPVAPDKMKEWAAYMDSVKLCDRNDPKRPCPGQS